MIQMKSKCFVPSGYNGYREKLVNLSPSEARIQILNPPTTTGPEGGKLGVVITTQCSKSLLGGWSHVLAADCDSVQAKDMVEGYFSRLGLMTKTVESSPERFWLFTNHVGNWKDICSKLVHCTGVDPKWFVMCKELGFLCFRAFPKRQGYPKFEDNEVHFSNFELSDWWYHFRSWYSSHFFAEITEKTCPAKTCPECKSKRGGDFCATCGFNLKDIQAPALSSVITTSSY